MIAAKNHANGVHNPYAHVRKALGVEFCNTVSERNPLVAGPLRRTDCSMVSDGAAALVVADEETAATLARRAIRFRARTHVNDFLPLSRRDPIAFEGARLAWDKARAEAGVTLDDLELGRDPRLLHHRRDDRVRGHGPGRARRRLARDSRGRDAAQRQAAGQRLRRTEGQGPSARRHRRVAARDGGDAADWAKPATCSCPRAELAGVFNMGGAAVTNYVSILERAK